MPTKGGPFCMPIHRPQAARSIFAGWRSNRASRGSRRSPGCIAINAHRNEKPRLRDRGEVWKGWKGYAYAYPAAYSGRRIGRRQRASASPNSFDCCYADAILRRAHAARMAAVRSRVNGGRPKNFAQGRGPSIIRPQRRSSFFGISRGALYSARVPS
jgi:hypothetical protein